MKGLFFTVLGGVITAILLYFVNNYLDRSTESGKQIVQYQISANDLQLEKDELSKIAASVDQYFSKVSFARVRVRNAGTEAISNQEAVLRLGDGKPIGKGIVGFDEIKTPGDDPESVSVAPEGNQLRIKYKLLNPGEEHDFWVAYNDIAMPSLTVRKPGLSLEDGIPPQPSGEWDFSDWLIAIALLGGALVIGLAIGYGSVASELKARGIDVDAELKKPKVSSGSEA